jgi:membrane protein implicated in regulation of membrane protease activity
VAVYASVMVLPLVGVLVAFLVLPPGWGAVLLVAVVAWEIAEKLIWLRVIGRYPVLVGREALIGSTVTVTNSCFPVGRVRLKGESWAARCEAGARSGETLVVEDVEQITLIVAKKQTATTAGAG